MTWLLYFKKIVQYAKDPFEWKKRIILCSDNYKCEKQNYLTWRIKPLKAYEVKPDIFNEQKMK